MAPIGRGPLAQAFQRAIARQEIVPEIARLTERRLIRVPSVRSRRDCQTRVDGEFRRTLPVMASKAKASRLRKRREISESIGDFMAGLAPATHSVQLKDQQSFASILPLRSIKS
jgi:hypothetical protein